MTFSNESRRAGSTAVHGVLSGNRQDPNSKPPAAAQAFVVTDARLVRKNSLVGTFDVEMPSGLIVRGAMLLEKNGSRWINFPSKKWIKPDGSKGFFPLLEFKDRATRDRFQAHVLPLAEAALICGPGGGPNDDIGF
jgi:hypothetical protein